MKLAEGKRYKFLVEKTVSLGNKAYFLLKGPGDAKYLLKKALYENYNIREGEHIDCRVDKINCRGEVFLEPANPFYIEGREYDFEISGKDVRLDEYGEVIPVLLVKDVFNRELVVPMRDVESYKDKNIVRLRVKRINKGRICFTGAKIEKKGDRIEDNSIYEFHIIDIMKGMDGKEYYLVTDPNKKYHVIPCRQYSYYGLKKGGSFRGRFIRYQESDKFRIEPINPYYLVGHIYEFRLVSEGVKPDGKSRVLIVSDEYGLHHEVSVPSDYQVSEKMIFSVDKIRKGWPLLVPV